MTRPSGPLKKKTVSLKPQPARSDQTSVLVIEDDERTRRLFTSLLQREGFAVHEAANGLDGLTTALNIKPALLVLDIHIPGLDGLSLARALKGQPFLADMKILVITADVSPQLRQEFKDIGVAGYVVKPIEGQQFIDQVRASLEAR